MHVQVSFGLCWGHRAGGPLCVFTPENVEEQLHVCAMDVLEKTVTIDT
jgi:hypothetical protein